MSTYQVSTVRNCTVGNGTGKCSSCNPPTGCGMGYDCSFYLSSCSSSMCCSTIQDSTMTAVSYYICMPYKGTKYGWSSYLNTTNTSSTKT